MKYAIVADSSCDIKVNNDKEQISEDVCLYRIPLKLRVGEKEYVDDCNLDVEEFMTTMENYPGATGSAAPSPGEWYDAFKDAENIFAVTITGALSGSYGSANAGMDMLLEKYPEKKVHIVDSKSAGGGVAIIVRKLEELAKQGLSFEEICKAIDEYKVKTIFMLDSMENLVKNGRVSPLVGKIVGMLGIKIIGEATDEGKIELLHKCRGKDAIFKKAVNSMIDFGYNGGKVVITHCFNEEKVKYFISLLEEKFGKINVEYIQNGGLCSYYAERRGIIVGFEY